MHLARFCLQLVFIAAQAEQRSYLDLLVSVRDLDCDFRLVVAPALVAAKLAEDVLGSFHLRLLTA